MFCRWRWAELYLVLHKKLIFRCSCIHDINIFMPFRIRIRGKNKRQAVSRTSHPWEGLVDSPWEQASPFCQAGCRWRLNPDIPKCAHSFWFLPLSMASWLLCIVRQVHSVKWGVPVAWLSPVNRSQLGGATPDEIMDLPWQQISSPCPLGCVKLFRNVPHVHMACFLTTPGLVGVKRHVINCSFFRIYTSEILSVMDWSSFLKTHQVWEFSGSYLISDR